MITQQHDAPSPSQQAAWRNLWAQLLEPETEEQSQKEGPAGVNQTGRCEDEAPSRKGAMR